MLSIAKYLYPGEETLRSQPALPHAVPTPAPTAGAVCPSGGDKVLDFVKALCKKMPIAFESNGHKILHALDYLRSWSPGGIEIHFGINGEAGSVAATDGHDVYIPVAFAVRAFEYDPQTIR